MPVFRARVTVVENGVDRAAFFPDPDPELLAGIISNTGAMSHIWGLGQGRMAAREACAFPMYCASKPISSASPIRRGMSRSFRYPLPRSTSNG